MMLCKGTREYLPNGLGKRGLIDDTSEVGLSKPQIVLGNVDKWITMMGEVPEDETVGG